MQNIKDLLKKPFDRAEFENFKQASTISEAEFAQVSIPMDENADLDEILKRLRWNGAFGPDGNIYERAAGAIERLRATPALPDGEAVAWRKHPDTDVITFQSKVADRWRQEGFDVIALYASPPPASGDVKMEPLK